MKDKKRKKKALRQLALPFLEQLQIQLRDLLQYFLRLSERAQALFHLFLEFFGDGDLAYLAIAETHGENPNRPVAFALALLAEPAAGLIAAHHAAQQGTGQDGGKIRHLLKELLAGSGKLSDLIFHFYKMKDIMLRNATQEKNDKTPQKCFTQRDATASDCPAVPGERYPEIDVGFPRRTEQAHAQVWAAIIQRRPIAALYRRRRRLLCPHLLGWNRHRRLQVLCYQYGGESGLKPAGASDNWRCLAAENLSQLELLEGSWQTAENHSRPQTCIEEVELDVDAYFESISPGSLPDTKSAKL
jgi:hypothetical protein